MNVLTLLPLLAIGQVHSNLTAQPGSLVTLDASASAEGDTYAWVFVSPPGHPFVTTGVESRVIAFATKCHAESYAIVLLAIKVDSNGKPSVATTTYTVTVEGTIPPNPNPPNPNPPGPDPPIPPTPPEPPEPPGPTKFGLSRLVYDEAMKLDSGEKAKASRAADNFDRFAAKMAAGTYSGTDRAQIDAANLDIVTANRAIPLGAAWMAWGQAVGAKMNSLWTSGDVRTPNNYAEAWREIASGLRSVQ